MAANPLIKVVVNTLDGRTLSPAEDRWINPSYIEVMSKTAANGAIFRYQMPSSGYSHEYRTDTAASAIATLADA